MSSNRKNTPASIKNINKAGKKMMVVTTEEDDDIPPAPPVSWMFFTKNFIQQSPDYNDFDAVFDTVVRSNKLNNLHYMGYKYVVSNKYSTPSQKKDSIIRLDKDVYFEVIESKMNEKNGDIHILTFKIHSKAHTIEYLKDFVRKCKETYDINVNDKLGHNDTYFFDHIIPENYEHFSKVIFEKRIFKSNKNFENLFYPEKETVHDRVQHFINNPEWYKDKGIPHMLGFMFHGLPGTGKTSTIKAIANLTGRHIVNVRLSEIKTKTCLKNLFCNDTLHIINDENNKLETFRVPINKRLYVIEDIDAMSDLIRKREFQHDELKKLHQAVDNTKSDTPTSKGSDDDNDMKESGLTNYSGDNLEEYYKEAIIQAETMEMQKDQKRKRDRDKVTFSDILNILDGTLEIPGRMICFTTNHIKIIDDALIRPGRIDMIVEYINANLEDIQNMFEKFYDLEMDSNLFDGIKEHTISPAKITQIMFKHLTDPDTALHEVTVISNRKGLEVSKSSKRELTIPDNKKGMVAKKSTKRASVDKPPKPDSDSD